MKKYVKIPATYERYVCNHCGETFLPEEIDSSSWTTGDPWGGDFDYESKCPYCGSEDIEEDDWSAEKEKLQERFENLVKKTFEPQEIALLNEIYEGGYICEDVIFEEVDE